ncbi:MAG: DUF433 domain-containing protein [Chloroflexi bacterium]|nr:DUF433 domain-containing protein [Chloroflexota bacterium]
MARQTVIGRSKDILGGTPVFKDTRVPVNALIDHLEAGDSLDDFLADFPTVSRGQALEVSKGSPPALMQNG